MLADRKPHDEKRPLQSNEADALAELAVRYRRRLNAFIRKDVGNHEDALELTQQTFYEAVRALPSFRHEASMHTWLYGIAANLIRHHFSNRKSKAWSEQDMDTLNEEQLDVHAMSGPNLDPIHLLANQQFLKHLVHHVANLPYDMRASLLLVAIDEHSYQDTAQQLGVPVGTVRSRIARARGILRDKMLEDGFEIVTE